MPQEPSKETLRRAVWDARSALSPAQWQAEDDARRAHLREALAGLPVGVVALFASRPGEPSTSAIIDDFAAAGWGVLLPVLRREPDWAFFDGWAAMTPGWADIPEPTSQRLGASALSRADVIVVPCLGLGRDGTRLGTGGAWYDRALPRRRPGALVIALTRTEELHDSVPTEPHDVSVDGYVSEAGSVLFNR